MNTPQTATILFAELSVSAGARATAGKPQIARGIERLRRAAAISGGKVIRVTQGEVMLYFDTPDSAAIAASRMHASLETLPAVDGTKVGAKIGFLSGPVVRSGDDVLGDTVKLAAQLLREAQRGQTVTTRQTAGLLGPSSRPFADHIRVRQDPEVLPYQPRATSMLRLNYGSDVAICWHENKVVVVGRERGCGLVVPGLLVSRLHCTIRLGQDGFTLLDHSSNGTYLTNEGAEEIVLQESEAPLAAHGWVAFGLPRTEASEVLEFTGH